VKFRADDIDRINGFDSTLTWQCDIRNALNDSLLYSKNGTTKDTSVTTLVFAPFYNDNLSINLDVSDANTNVNVNATASISSVSNYTYSANGWHMAALPSKEGLLPAVFADTNISVFSWTTAENSYKSLTANDTIKKGRSVWIYSDSSLTADVLPHKRLLSAEPCTLKLDSGWNMITSPYAFAVKPLIPNGEKLFQYKNGDYVETTVLTPWSGCFYHSDGTNLILNGVPDMADSSSFTAGKLFKSTNEWRIRVIAEGMDGSKDGSNWLGVAPMAKVGYDAFDAHKPPTSPMGGVSIAFDNNGGLLSQSIKAPELTNEWLMTVNNSNGQPFSLTFDGVLDLPDNCYAFLCDGPTITNIKTTGKISIRAAGKKVLRVVITNDANYADKQVVSFELFQNSPNPFNPITDIGFSVPLLFSADGTPISGLQTVSLNIYDMRGRLIQTLVKDEMKTGKKYNATWNGKDLKGNAVSSGVYVYRIKIGSKFVQSKYLVLSR
jgi:hypothetical protein